MASELADVDGNVEDRRGIVSAFNGEPPETGFFDDAQREVRAVGDWLKALGDKGIDAAEMGVFVRSVAELDRARNAVHASGLSFRIMDECRETTTGGVSISTMHLAKGLEFRAVAVMACDDEVIPRQERIETAADPADLEEVYNTERHLLYVACTRARDYLMVSGVKPASEFLEDLAV